MARKRKINELEEILLKIPADRQYIGRKIVDELIFMNETLAELRNKIKENGTEEEFVQGKQRFTREAPALTSYNKIVQQYSKLYKQLTDLMQKAPEPQKSNAVYDFLKAVNYIEEYLQEIRAGRCIVSKRVRRQYEQLAADIHNPICG